MAMLTNINWTFVAFVGTFIFGMIIGNSLGRRKAMLDMLYQQQRMEATRMWTESIGKVAGGHNVEQ